jgi:hypothetical protein
MELLLQGPRAAPEKIGKRDERLLTYTEAVDAEDQPEVRFL